MGEAQVLTRALSKLPPHEPASPEPLAPLAPELTDEPDAPVLELLPEDAAPLDEPVLAPVEVMPLAPVPELPPEDAAPLDEPALAPVEFALLPPVLAPPVEVPFEPQATAVRLMVSVSVSVRAMRHRVKEAIVSSAE